MQKVKVNVVSVLIDWAPSHEDMLENEGTDPSFLASALDGGESSASRHDHFTPGERAPGAQWVGDCVGLRFGLDNVEKINLLLLSGIKPRALDRWHLG
jgi:hypothetical protein